MFDTHDNAGGERGCRLGLGQNFPNQSPIGRRFRLNKSDLIIVGVAKEAGYSSSEGAIPPVVYLPYLQDALHQPPGPMWFELRAVGNPLPLAETVRKIVHKAAATVPVTDVMTQTQLIDSTITEQRTFADLCRPTHAILGATNANTSDPSYSV